MTFRVILRKDVIYKNNTSPLCLLFFHDNRKKSVGLGVSVSREYWDAEAQKIMDDCPDRDDIHFQITAKIKEYEKKIKKLEALEIPVTFETLFETVGKRMDCTVGDYFKQIIDRLEKVEKYGSASKHKVTLALMSHFRSVNMRFDELDLTYLREFEIVLRQRGNVNNSLATKFSVLKAVYNKAVSDVAPSYLCHSLKAVRRKRSIGFRIIGTLRSIHHTDLLGQFRELTNRRARLPLVGTHHERTGCLHGRRDTADSRSVRPHPFVHIVNS